MASSKRNQFLEWFPFYVHRFINDPRYRALKDYQQAWFLNLLFASWISERPGYLPDDGQLWRLATFSFTVGAELFPNSRQRSQLSQCQMSSLMYIRLIFAL